ncbi:sugar phosphate isomerase/epimerase family protein [Cohnella caldifontis]|uniref:sugar phosphate isomerase/epimerase family protein n=1 Tax=Cohnella caldifontis TaxID=3027471 RepID=UPI0023EB57F1|nr:TIM barrel protein [Cohnella sp. YIM B05605]
MQLKLGVSTGFAIKRWADPGDWVRIVKEELGLDTVQFSLDQFDPRSRPDNSAAYAYRVRNACAKFGVVLHSTFTGLSIYSHNLLMHPLWEGRRDGVDWFEKAFALTEALGASGTGGPYGGMDIASYQAVERREAIERSAEECMAYLLSQAPRYGIDTFYWEQTPIRREGPVGIEDTLRHLERMNALRDPQGAAFALCLDVGHAIAPDAEGEDRDPYRWLEKLAPYAPIIHLQQTDGRYDRHWPFTPEFNDKGIIDGVRVLEAIRRSGTDGALLLIEVGHPFEESDAKVLGDMKRTADYWRESLKRGAGLEGGEQTHGSYR